MKLDKIRFAMLINWLSRNGLHELAAGDIEEIDSLIDIQVPEPPPETLHVLMALMQEGTRKIEAIKQHRMMTGYGLKESKDIIDKYWPNHIAHEYDLNADEIKQVAAFIAQMRK